MLEYGFRLFSSIDECINDVRDRGDQPDRIFILKNYTSPYSCATVVLKPDKTILSCYPYDDVFYDFYNFCTDIESGIKLPVPFKKGDIVWYPNGGSKHPFVFIGDKLAVAGMEVYSFYDDAGIYRDCYEVLSTGIEYYHTETLTDENCALQILSQFLKGKINVVKFANGYHRILTEASVKNFDMPKFEEEMKWEEISDDDDLPF